MIRKLKTYLTGSVRRKLLAQIILVSVLPLIMIGIVYTVGSSIFVISGIQNNLRTEEGLVFAEMEERFGKAERLCRSLEENADVQDYLRRNFETKSERYSLELKAGGDLFSRVRDDEWIEGVYILGENGLMLQSGDKNFLTEDYQDFSWYRKTMASRGPCWYTAHKGSYIAGSVTEQVLTLCYPFRDAKSRKNIGVILADIDLAKFVSVLEGINFSEEGYYLLNSDNTIFYRTGSTAFLADYEQKIVKLLREHSAQIQNNKRSIVSIEEGNLMILVQKSSVTDWSILSHFFVLSNRYTVG